MTSEFYIRQYVESFFSLPIIFIIHKEGGEGEFGEGIIRWDIEPHKQGGRSQPKLGFTSKMHIQVQSTSISFSVMQKTLERRIQQI